jgi:hypothetical protein
MMTIEEKCMRNTIDMAREAGYMKTVFGGTEISMASIDCLKDFESLVRADERNSWPAEIKAMERQVNILTDALAKRKPLTDEEIELIFRESSGYGGDDFQSFARAIEAKLKEKTVTERNVR